MESTSIILSSRVHSFYFLILNIIKHDCYSSSYYYYSFSYIQIQNYNILITESSYSSHFSLSQRTLRVYNELNVRW